MKLLAIAEDGNPRGLEGAIPGELTGAIEATIALYKKVGFMEPWISYLAAHDGEVVGICSFKSAPVNGRVEIAYHTLPDHEGHGFATAMARELVALARLHDDTLTIAAQTLPDRNASHRVLEKVGFRTVGFDEDDEAGTVLDWRLDKSTAP